MNRIKENRVLKNVVAFILSYLSVEAFAYIVRLGKSDSEIFSMLDYGTNILYVFVFGLGVFLISKYIVMEEKKIKIISFISGLILSILSVWGAYALFVNDIFISKKETIIQIFLVFGLNLIFTPIVAEVFLLMKKFDNWCESKKENKNYSRKNNIIYFLIVWVAIFLCYLPVFLANWPGNFIYDAKYQLSEVINNSYKTHHPLIHTWLMGTCYKLGVEWGSASKGFQIYTLLQMLVLSSSFSYCLLYLRKKGIPRLFRVISFLWFAIFPMHSIFSITATKDVLFAAFFLYSMIFFLRYFYDKEKFQWYTYVAMIVFNVLAALFRNNAIYALVVFCIIAIIMIKGLKEKGKIVILLSSIYIITTLCNTLMVNGLNAYPGAKNRESLSVPLQGLARVASYRGDELYEFEYNEIVMYIREQDISSYVPCNSDNIKNEANESLLETNKLNFIKLWLKIGSQYPDEYIESIVANTMGYWYLLPMKDYVTMNLSLYHSIIGAEHELEKVGYCSWAEKILNYYFYEGNYKYNPILSYSFRLAPYIWFMIFTLVWSLIKKDKKATLIMLLPFLYFGTCLLGPTVAIRYVYCLVVCCPLYFYMIKRKEE